jgi:hypothetical protein
MEKPITTNQSMGIISKLKSKVSSKPKKKDFIEKAAGKLSKRYNLPEE